MVLAVPFLHVLTALASLCSAAASKSEWSEFDASVHLQVSSSSRSTSLDAGVGDSNGQSDAAWDLGPSRDVLGHRAVLCTLPICRTAGPDAPLLFVNEFTDGLGHRIRGIFNSIALASKLHMNFGGMLIAPSDWVHKLHTRDVIKRWFNFTNNTQLYINRKGHNSHSFYPELDKRPNFDFEFKQERRLEKERSHIGNTSKVWLNSPQLGTDKESERLSHEFREQMRNNLDIVPRSEFAPDGVHVAMHVRRDDLGREEAMHFASNAWFLNIKRRISRALACDPAPPDFHVWSSLDKIWQHWTPEDFQVFRDEGMNVHLDSEDVLAPLAHFAFADVLVLPGYIKSHFSMIAAVLNAGCIVTPLAQNRAKDLYDAIGVEALNPERDSFEDDLRDCLRRTHRKWSCPRLEEPNVTEGAPVLIHGPLYAAQH